MGVVYKAQDLKLDRSVALKFLLPELTRDPEAKQRFIQEAKAASALQHNAICTVHDIDQTDDGQLFIVMDFYEGETLETMIERGPLEIKDVIDIGIQVAQGLAKAHAHGIVHRDIKPANIMLTPEGAVKIVDFGLAKLGGQAKLTKEGSTRRTAAYMSPEQARGESVDARTDIWSLGVVMYEMTTGQRPFKSDYDQALVYAILNEAPEPAERLRTEAPAALTQLVAKALQKESAQRFENIDEFLASLNSLKKEREADTGIPRGAHRILPSIAVLPFDNMSPDPENEYFSDGLAEELINALSQLEGLHVTARTSTFRFRGKEVGHSRYRQTAEREHRPGGKRSQSR